MEEMLLAAISVGTRRVGCSQLCGKHISAAVNQHLIVELDLTQLELESRVKAVSNTSTLALRVVGGDVKGTQCLGV
jgi:hypothetical protein